MEYKALLIVYRTFLVESRAIFMTLLMGSSNRSDRKQSQIEFGAHQVLLMRTQASKDKLPSFFDGILATTILEAKGLEVIVCCSVLQYVAVWCSVVQCGAVWCNLMQCGETWCSVLQCDAVFFCSHYIVATTILKAKRQLMSM